MGRILHLTDIHFGCENKPAVQAVLDYAVREAFDLTVITGDITQYGREAEFVAAEQWVAALPGPLLLTPGNHDTPIVGVIGRIFAPFARYQRAFGASWANVHEGEGVSVRAFNSSRGVQFRANWSKGAVKRSQAETAARGLAAAPAGNLKIAVCHHPLMEVTGGPMTGAVHGGAQAARILADGGADLILTGHVHTPFVLELPLADGKTYAVGAATLSLRERGAPAGFNVIDWDENAIRVVAHGWTGSHFEVQKTWALARRSGASAPASP